MSSVALFTCPRLDGMVGVMLQRQKGGALNLKRHSDALNRDSIETRRTLLVVSIRPFTSDQILFSHSVVQSFMHSGFPSSSLSQSLG